MRLAAMVVLAGLFAALAGPALAQEKRVALVIGNDAYKGLPKLNNAVADARAMDKKLKELGFETIVRTNVGRTDMGRAISEFGRKIGTPETVGLVFYSGHGIQAFDRNWLIPVDANLESDDDLQTEAVDAQRILAAMDEARNPLNIVILDACRDNPLPKKGRSAARGLAVVSVAPRGSVIAYSASPNQKADDGNPGTNGVYTAELLKALDEPGLTVEQVLKRANGGVQRATGGRQVPWFNASIQGDFYFRPGAPGAVVTPAPAPVGPDAATVELAFWDSVKNSTDVADFEEYLRKYPKGQFAGLARNKVRALKAPPQQTAAVTAPPPSRDPQARPAQPAVGTYDLQPGQVFRDCNDCPEMVVIPAGSFVMGSTEDETSREKVPDEYAKWEKPQHRVNVRSFMLGKYEVTRGEYAAFVRETGRGDGDGCRYWTGSWRNPGYGQDDRHPFACVSWDDAKAYTAWLSRKTGKGYRLASEAEWEYAARAGTTTARHWGDAVGQNNANCDGCGSRWDEKSTAPVGSFRTNAFGLHDMIGNVWEWTEDCWNENYSGAPADGSSWQTGNCQRRVLRGGSWISRPWNARSAGRNWILTGIRINSDIGFRAARTY